MTSLSFYIKLKLFFRKYFTKLLLFILFIHIKMTFFEFAEKKKFQFRTLLKRKTDLIVYIIFRYIFNNALNLIREIF